MKEEASKKPFSFHVNEAFAPWSFWLEEWKIPVMAISMIMKNDFAKINYEYY